MTKELFLRRKNAQFVFFFLRKSCLLGQCKFYQLQKIASELSNAFLPFDFSAYFYSLFPATQLVWHCSHLLSKTNFPFDLVALPSALTTYILQEFSSLLRPRSVSTRHVLFFWVRSFCLAILMSWKFRAASWGQNWVRKMF